MTVFGNKRKLANSLTMLPKNACQRHCSLVLCSIQRWHEGGKLCTLTFVPSQYCMSYSDAVVKLPVHCQYNLWKKHNVSYCVTYNCRHTQWALLQPWYGTGACTASSYTTYLLRLTLFSYGQLILTLSWQWIPLHLQKHLSTGKNNSLKESQSVLSSQHFYNPCSEIYELQGDV